MNGTREPWGVPLTRADLDEMIGDALREDAALGNGRRPTTRSES